MSPKTAASYGRTSMEHDDAFSVSSQHKGNRQYAKEHDIHLPSEYEFSEDFTGKVIDRPELGKVRQLIRTKAIDTLIVYATDRLARDTGVANYLLEECVRHDVALHIVSWGGPVRDTPEDRLRFDFESVFSAYERRKIVERTMRGKREKIERGQWMCAGPPRYGYRVVGTKRTQHLEIVESEAAVVRDIFRWLVYEHCGTAEIVRRLNAEGTTSPSTARNRWNKIPNWRIPAIYGILHDEGYIGVFWANQSRMIDGKRQPQPRDKQDRLDFPDLAIIDRKTFDLAQAIVAKGRKRFAPENRHSDHLLARRLTCTCGYALGIKTTENRYKSRVTKKTRVSVYPYYVCPGRSARFHLRDRVPCVLPPLHQEYIDNEVWSRIEALLKNPKEQLETLRAAQLKQIEDHAEAIDHLKAAEQTQAEHDRKLRQYYQDYEDGLLPRDLFIEKKAKLDQRLEAAQAVANEYRQVLENVLTDDDIAAITGDLDALREELESLDELSLEKRRAVIERMHVTGKLIREDDTVILWLYVYSIPIGSVSVEAKKEPTRWPSTTRHCGRRPAVPRRSANSGRPSQRPWWRSPSGRRGGTGSGRLRFSCRAAARHAARNGGRNPGQSG
jgi:site-specific DNA recombinase